MIETSCNLCSAPKECPQNTLGTGYSSANKTFYPVFIFLPFSLIDATHKDVDVLLLLSNSAYYVA